MAKDDKKTKSTRRRRRSAPTVNIKSINGYIDSIEKGMNKLYGDTYLSSRDNLDSLNRITDDIEDSIVNIIKRNNDNNISGISKLYSKMMIKGSNNDKITRDKLEELFSTGDAGTNLLSSYMSNKWIHDLDIEIDTVLQYCTKMGEALDLLKDAVISSDSNTKDNIMVKANISDDTELSVFDDKTKQMIKKYNLSSKEAQWYMNASKYGEQWVYVVPYSRAIKTLLDDRHKDNIYKMPVTESGSICKGFDNVSGDIQSVYTTSKDIPNFTVEIDTSRSLASAIESTRSVNEGMIHESGTSLYEQVLTEESTRKPKMDKTIEDDLELPKDFDSSSSDGLISSSKSRNSDNDVKVKGAVVQDLKRENLIPLYIQDTCLGYYYIEFNNSDGFNFYNTMIDKYGRGYEAQANSTLTKTVNDGMLSANTDNILKKVAVNIANKLDAAFVNSNQDITKEIYAILKYNNVYNSNATGPESMKISFLPVEDVHRLVFNEDSETHRGISDCAKGLIPAKLFSCLYITDTTGKLTRGQDKRVYYVKQTVDTNIAQTLQNVVNQIKKSNFNIRQIENMNNILNVVGRFNDYFIPVGQSGDSPIQFEIMPGQQFDIDSDLYNMLEEMAVNSTGVNIDMVNARIQPEFATQFTSNSLKVLRMVYSRQTIMEEFLSDIFTAIYNCEYQDDNYTLSCELPPPLFLVMTNTSQIIQNVKEYVTQIAEYEYNGDTSPNVDQERAIFERKLMRSILSSYIKASEIERHKRAAKFELQNVPKEQ